MDNRAQIYTDAIVTLGLYSKYNWNNLMSEAKILKSQVMNDIQNIDELDQICTKMHETDPVEDEPFLPAVLYITSILEINTCVNQYADILHVIRVGNWIMTHLMNHISPDMWNHDTINYHKLLKMGYYIHILEKYKAELKRPVLCVPFIPITGIVNMTSSLYFEMYPLYNSKYLKPDVSM